MAIVWKPTPRQIGESNLKRFMLQEGLSDLAALHARAAHDPAWFWDAVVKDLEIHWYKGYDRVMDTSRGIEWTRWFTGGLMNAAYDCTQKHPAGNLALVFEGEEGRVQQWTFGELHAEVGRAAGALRALGVAPGDRVGIFMPMIPEIAAVLLAIARIGAVAVPVFSGFSAQAVAARLSDCEAKVLVTADGFFRRGKPVAMKAVADEACGLAPSVEQVLVVRRIGCDVAWCDGRDHWYHEAAAWCEPVMESLPVSAETPMMLIYTSGTTGKPKGALHVHGGFPLKAAQDMAHCFDVKPGDRMFWFTDIGWMMGPWVILGSLMLGTTCFLYDGAPDFPHAGRLWALVQRHQLTHLGVSPTLVRALMAQGDEAVERFDRSSLRVLGSTGEMWTPEPYRWLFGQVGEGRCPIINYSGGTEISGGILGCVPILPIKECAFNCVIPGMDAVVLDEAGGVAPAGAVGELALRAPWPGMTRSFWRDDQRYLDSYWSRYPGIWVHGDFASVDEDGCWFVHGRSDDTLKIAGKRVGPGEIEAALAGHPAVAEAAAIGVPDAVKGEAAVCLVALRPGFGGSAAVAGELVSLVVAALGKPLAPRAVHFVPALPKTRNGKVMRRVIRAAYLGKPAGDTLGLENPEALEAIARVAVG